MIVLTDGEAQPGVVRIDMKDAEGRKTCIWV